MCKSLREHALRMEDDESSTGMGFKFLGLPANEKLLKENAKEILVQLIQNYS